MSGLPIITSAVPLISVLRYAHLGIAVSNFSRSVEFFSKIGFSVKTNEDSRFVVLRNRGGMELHLFQCDKPLEDDRNILMDYPENKFPGHTHASFSVPNVASTRDLLESQGLLISGERKMGDKLFAIFTRDPDRTTYEFEKNDGIPVEVEVTAEMIGFPQPIDHIGIRVSTPEECWLWYANILGFVFNAKKYVHNEDMLKNGPPWISRTHSNVDINFIVNANEQGAENVLIAGGLTRPGIVYAAFVVDDVCAAEDALRGAGVVVTRDVDLHASSTLGCLTTKAILQTDSIFFQDPNLNILRLVSNSACTQL